MDDKDNLIICFAKMLEEIDNFRGEVFKKNDPKTTLDDLFFKYPAMQGTRNIINLRKLSQLPCDYSKASVCIDDLLSREYK